MSEPVLSITFSAPPIDVREILRYANCPSDYDTSLVNECLKEVSEQLQYSVCFRRFPLKINGELIDMEFVQTYSADLARLLSGCDGVLVFAATIGIGIDRLIYRYGRLAPSKALFLQAIGAERIEALCNCFCQKQAESENGCLVTPRFSPGYGDLPLSIQTQIVCALDCQRRIGITLNDSLLMSPSKSVTAILGIKKKGEVNEK